VNKGVLNMGEENKFGSYLQQIRKAKGLGVNQLAQYSGVSAPQISRIESGKRTSPKPDTIAKLANALKVPYEELMKVAGYLEQDSVDKKDNDENYNSLSEINKLIKKYGIEQMGFLDIEKWKNFGPAELRLLEKQFQLIVEMSEERDKKND
jgi:transcriptional regulator with XRE-family HTH domain